MLGPCGGRRRAWRGLHCARDSGSLRRHVWLASRNVAGSNRSVVGAAAGATYDRSHGPAPAPARGALSGPLRPMSCGWPGVRVLSHTGRVDHSRVIPGRKNDGAARCPAARHFPRAGQRSHVRTQTAAVPSPAARTGPLRLSPSSFAAKQTSRDITIQMSRKFRRETGGKSSRETFTMCQELQGAVGAGCPTFDAGG